ncbi:MAG: YqgE/AlgH family protein [Spirochaetaceae bacterium]|nr:MAG: YqgE/AlgH family protein [Spirochaetaceae bacterium]
MTAKRSQFVGGEVQPNSFEGDIPVPDSLAGHFLISETDLLDPNFFRTVVLMTDHGAAGAFGLVVNRKSTAGLKDLIPDFENDPAGDIPVYVGGPVEQQYLFVLHSGIPTRFRSDHSVSPTPGVIFEPLTEPLVHFLRDEWRAIPLEDRPKIHLFAGYSGWGPLQLESELEAGAWYIHRATADIVFHADPEKGWHDALSKKGPLYKIIAETGIRPSMN